MTKYNIFVLFLQLVSFNLLLELLWKSDNDVDHVYAEKSKTLKGSQTFYIHFKTRVNSKL